MADSKHIAGIYALLKNIGDMEMSYKESLRKSGKATGSAGAPSTQTESAVWAMTIQQVEDQGFEDGYLGSKFDTSFRDRDPASEYAVVYETGYFKGDKQFEIDAEMADRGEWPPVGVQPQKN